MSKSTLDVLIAARKLINKPIKWGRGRRGTDRPLNTCCTAEAIENAAPFGSPGWANLRLAAYRAVGNVVHRESLVSWNDEPDRTHAEVLAAFDRAIEAERAKGAA